MAKTLLTQIGVTRYDEIVTSWLDGSLQKKWEQLKDGQLTKNQQVEERQIRAIAFMMRADDKNPKKEYLMEVIKSKKWRLLKFYTDGDRISLEVLG